MRLFVALNLPEKQRIRIFDEVSALREAGFPVRWVDPDCYHVTLKFLGEVRQENVARIEGALSAAASGSKPFSTSIAGVGAFPTVRRPRVIWLGVDASPELRCLKQDVEWALGDIGFTAETRAFHPHVTLGRADEHGGAGAFRGLDELVPSVGFLETLDVGTVDLMSSRFSRQGPDYRIVRRFDLAVS